MVLGHQISRQVRKRLVVFSNQLVFRCQPIPHIVARLRTCIYIIEVCLFSNVSRCGCELLYCCRPCWARGLRVLVRGVVFMFHTRILGGIMAGGYGVLPDRMAQDFIKP
jgi:hypothetical protein